MCGKPAFPGVDPDDEMDAGKKPQAFGRRPARAGAMRGKTDGWLLDGDVWGFPCAYNYNRIASRISVWDVFQRRCAAGAACECADESPSRTHLLALGNGLPSIA